LGGVGLLRFKFLITDDVLFGLLAFCVVGYISAAVLRMVQTDFKKLVAYSSVFHMTAIVFLYALNTVIREMAIIIVLFRHGLVSPLLFYLVSIVQEKSSTRQLLLIGNSLYLFTMVIEVATLFLFNIPTPPFV